MRHPHPRLIAAFTTLVLAVAAVVTNVATSEGSGIWWWALLGLLLVAAVLLGVFDTETDASASTRGSHRPWGARAWAVTGFAALVLLVATVSIVHDRPWVNAPSPEAPPSQVSVPGVLRDILVRQSDLDTEWETTGTPPGSRYLNDDELCGRKPETHPSQEQVAVFSRPLRVFGTSVPRAALFSVAAVFSEEQYARNFMAETRELAGSCTNWQFTPGPGMSPVTCRIASARAQDFGDEAFRVLVPGGGNETDYLYIRFGRVVSAVVYSLEDLPLISGDEHIDPMVVDELARVVEMRAEDLRF